MADTTSVTDQAKGLFSRTIQGEIKLFNRVSTLTTDATKALFARDKTKPLPSVGEGLTRLVALNLACWSAAADHSLALANDVAAACEQTFGLQAATPDTARRSRKSARKAKA